VRVIAGEFRSRKLIAPPGAATRPTPDRLRESLFSILQPEIEGVTFLDAYAGSGAVGIEALSRGARAAIFVERSRDAVEVLRMNLRALGLEARSEVFKGKAAQVLTHKTAHIIFLDPPYEQESEYDQALAVLAEHSARLVIVQHSVGFDPGASHGRLARVRIVKQGSNALTFYRLP
jgi:16S rRNA (guanine(966)-N(2))-methyltransferase RsmD